MAIVYILLAVTTVANLIWMAANFAEGDALDEKESDLDKYAVHLDERANKLAVWEEELKRREERI